MTSTVKSAIGIMEMLPAKEQNLALEAIKKIMLSWDPDYTKLTPSERRELEEAENGEFVDAEDIDWD